MSARAETGREAQATALVLAAGRGGREDPVARMQDTTHKCLVEIDGQVMLERVVGALLASGRIDRVLVSVESAEVLRATPQLSAWLEEGRMVLAESRDTLADSVVSAAETQGDIFPLVITTGDNVLHTSAFIRDFVDQTMRSQRDLVLAFTRKETVQAEYPEVELNWHELKDGGFSSCNVYALRTPRALTAAEVFRGGGSFGKKPLRLLKAFGLTPFFLYITRRATGADFIARTARSLGITADLAEMTYAYGPIDVDNPEFYAIAERILKDRREAA